MAGNQTLALPKPDQRPRQPGFWHQQAAWGYLLVLPAVLVVVGSIGYPILFSIWISATDRTVGTVGTFVGLQNFQSIVHWPSFGWAVGNTVVLVVTTIGAKLVLGLTLATLLNQPIRARWFFRGAMLIPWALPAFVGFLIWRMLYAPLGGAFNTMLASAGIVEMPIDWLSSSRTALAAVIIAAIWRGLPFFVITFLAGMQSIGQELYDAAAVDGATAWRRFLHVTLPGIRPIVLVVVLLETIWTSNTFTIVYLMTRGGPSDATAVFTMLAYQQGMLEYRLGEAAAVSVAFLPLLIVIVLIVARLLQKD
ncbi:MAG: sugar ABC transporter permease [Chloroflexi bacterium]|nr:sugar ABC transporter permease [Chloroflexota bacterium]